MTIADSGIRRYVRSGLMYLGAVVVLVSFLGPVVWLFAVSLRPESLTFQHPPAFVFRPTLINYLAVFQRLGLPRSFLNSLIVAVTVTLISTFFGSLTGHSLARNRVGGRPLLFGILITAMMPSVVLLIPVYLLFQRLQLVDTHLALILINTAMALPFSAWLMRGYYLDITSEYEDAALVDGCTRLGAFFRVALPLGAPGVVTTAMLCFIWVWNEYMFAVTLFQRDIQMVTVSVSLISLSRYAVEWGQMAAVGTLATLPVLLLAFLGRGYLLRGLALGATD